MNTDTDHADYTAARIVAFVETFVPREQRLEAALAIQGIVNEATKYWINQARVEVSRAMEDRQ